MVARARACVGARGGGDVKRSGIKPGALSVARGSTFSAKAPAKPGGRSTLKPGRGFAASSDQRAKVARQVCAVCGAEHCDPAHLAPRAMGRGCDDADCVIALCRPHHEAFDRGDLDLLPYVAARGFNRELAHMQWHYDDPLSVVIRLSGHRWVPEGGVPA